MAEKRCVMSGGPVFVKARDIKDSNRRWRALRLAFGGRYCPVWRGPGDGEEVTTRSPFVSCQKKQLGVTVSGSLPTEYR
jgi:hypothetical protein